MSCCVKVVSGHRLLEREQSSPCCGAEVTRYITFSGELGGALLYRKWEVSNMWPSWWSGRGLFLRTYGYWVGVLMSKSSLGVDSTTLT